MEKTFLWPWEDYISAILSVQITSRRHFINRPILEFTLKTIKKLIDFQKKIVLKVNLVAAKSCALNVLKLS